MNPNLSPYDSVRFFLSGMWFILRLRKIYRYLNELDIKVTDAVGEQAELLMQNNREYQIANEIGDLYKIGSIGNACRQDAREMVFAAMVYV